MPTVSVIIPFYNRIEWMLEAVDGVLAQTFRDFELIVVDDGSTEPFDPARLGPDRTSSLASTDRRVDRYSD